MKSLTNLFWDVIVRLYYRRLRVRWVLKEHQTYTLYSPSLLNMYNKGYTRNETLLIIFIELNFSVVRLLKVTKYL